MPPTTTYKEFLEQLKTGKTKIMKMLDKIFNDPANHPSEEVMGRLRVKNALDPGFEDPINVELKNKLDSNYNGGPMTQPVLEHLLHWPNLQKEEVRKAMVRCVDGDAKGQDRRGIHFFWHLTHESEVRVDIEWGIPGVCIVRFLNPASKMEIDGAAGVGNVVIRFD